MGVAFSDLEMETIRKKLIARARECLTRYGIQKTSVKDIVSAAGISTGAFYRFYESKEQLFFEVMEDMEREIYAEAIEVLEKRTDLVQRERVILAINSSFIKMDKLGLMPVWEAESAYMLRRLPDNVLENHYSAESSRIVDILSEFKIHTTLPAKEVAEIFQFLLTYLFKLKEFGKERSQSESEFIIRAICEKLLPDS